ncbi:unnamed protein product [Trichogramma brassicae]|uniref:C2H2-type domain-containing protein n=1 Tax=Trichogramma brassicae TaxID=86971 RepID=A0A6H5III2_9HYME|nr:unnamed protein product [Trichogramma brassicae]
MAKHKKSIHEGQKGYVCNVCQRTFAQQTNLIRHQRTVHERQRDYECGVCQRKFTLKFNLIVHQRTVHKGRGDYECDVCKKTSFLTCQLLLVSFYNGLKPWFALETLICVEKRAKRALKAEYSLRFLHVTHARQTQTSNLQCCASKFSQFFDALLRKWCAVLTYT